MKSTTVKINGGCAPYRVVIDEWNHTLERWREAETITKGKYAGTMSKPDWVTEGYYPNMVQCLKRIVKIESMEGGETDLEGYIQRLIKLEE